MASSSPAPGQPATLSLALGDNRLDYEYAWVLTPNQVGVNIRY